MTPAFGYCCGLPGTCVFRSSIRARKSTPASRRDCTGPECRTGRVANPLVQSLRSSGTIRSDTLSLGIDIADDGRPISRDGTPVDRLYYLGPWLRARDWEATAVPELREHAAQLAQSLARKNLVESVEQSC